MTWLIIITVLMLTDAGQLDAVLFDTAQDCAAEALLINEPSNDVDVRYAVCVPAGRKA